MKVLTTACFCFILAFQFGKASEVSEERLRTLEILRAHHKKPRMNSRTTEAAAIIKIQDHSNSKRKIPAKGAPDENSLVTSTSSSEFFRSSKSSVEGGNSDESSSLQSSSSGEAEEIQVDADDAEESLEEAAMESQNEMAISSNTTTLSLSGRTIASSVEAELSQFAEEENAGMK